MSTKKKLLIAWIAVIIGSFVSVYSIIQIILANL